MRPSIVQGWWKDTGKKEDLLHANELVLRDLGSALDGDLIDTTTRGAVQGSGSRLVDCSITGPAVIGRDTQLTRSVIGPNTAIGDRCHISDASVEDSIVLDGAEIHGWKLRDSLVGRRARLHGAAPQSFVEMTLGERSEVIGD